MKVADDSASAPWHQRTEGVASIVTGLRGIFKKKIKQLVQLYLAVHLNTSVMEAGWQPGSDKNHDDETKETK